MNTIINNLGILVGMRSNDIKAGLAGFVGGGVLLIIFFGLFFGYLPL